MGISSNASRIQIQTPAKNGTLGTQGSLNADQILFDTNISTNNSNLESSPTFIDRIVVIREGEVDEETNLITAVDVDGVTCTCHYDWVSAPANLDTYDVSYIMDDVETVTGCTRDSTNQEYIFDRKLQVGQNSSTFSLLYTGNYEVLQMGDSGASQETLETINGSRMDMGTRQGEVTTPGSTIIFTNDGDGEVVVQVRNGGTFNAYDGSLIASHASNGVELTVSIIAGGILNWRDIKLLGVTGPLKTRRKNFKDTAATLIVTKQDVVDSTMWGGWLKSEYDQVVFDELQSEDNDAKVVLIIEDK